MPTSHFISHNTHTYIVRYIICSMYPQPTTCKGGCWCIYITPLLSALCSLLPPVSCYRCGRLITEKERERAAQSAARGVDNDTIYTPTEVAPIGFWQAFMLPNVLSYAIAFGFFKLVNWFQMRDAQFCVMGVLLLVLPNLLWLLSVLIIRLMHLYVNVLSIVVCRSITPCFSNCQWYSRPTLTSPLPTPSPLCTQVYILSIYIGYTVLYTIWWYIFTPHHTINTTARKKMHNTTTIYSTTTLCVF